MTKKEFKKSLGEYEAALIECVVARLNGSKEHYAEVLTRSKLLYNTLVKNVCKELKDD